MKYKIILSRLNYAQFATYLRQNSGTKRMIIENICTRPKIMAKAQIEVCMSVKLA